MDVQTSGDGRNADNTGHCIRCTARKTLPGRVPRQRRDQVAFTRGQASYNSGRVLECCTREVLAVEWIRVPVNDIILDDRVSEGTS